MAFNENKIPLDEEEKHFNSLAHCFFFFFCTTKFCEESSFDCRNSNKIEFFCDEESMGMGLSINDVYN